MTLPSSPQIPETPLQKERRIFREQIKRLWNCFINKTFELTITGSQRRNRILVILFLFIGFVATLSAYPLVNWKVQLSSLFTTLFNRDFAAQAPQVITQFALFVFGALSDPRTLHFLPLFILPYMIALQSASMYLVDIFELKNIETAREFLLQVVFQGSNKSIRIGNGEVTEADKNSPIYQIGGPGQVLVELDTAALFEKPNGQPHVIGPSTKGKASLEGFERFRQAIDLRDQYTEPLEVTSRSFDGIPISTTDVRLVFSVWRDGKQPSAENPHPFSEKAIETLVYGQASRVALDGPHPSVPPSSWVGTIQGLIRGELSGFMSKHRLTEYLSSIGLPEIQQAREREEEIIKIGSTVVADEDSLKPRDIPPPPNFQPRHTVSNLFSQFAEGFSKIASKRGVELSWIGVGRWKTPNELVVEKHLEAWRLNRENMARGSKAALNTLREEARLQRTIRQIQNTPLMRFQENKDKEHKDIVQDLLIAYREQLMETIVLLNNSNKLVPSSVHAAIKHIETVLGITHWIGETNQTPKTDPSSPISRPDTPSSFSSVDIPRPSSKPHPPTKTPNYTTGVPSIPPSTPEEEELYQDLLAKVGHDKELVERLIEHERNRAPHASREYLIQRAIDRWLRDNR